MAERIGQGSDPAPGQGARLAFQRRVVRRVEPVQTEPVRGEQRRVAALLRLPRRERGRELVFVESGARAGTPCAHVERAAAHAAVPPSPRLPGRARDERVARRCEERRFEHGPGGRAVRVVQLDRDERREVVVREIARMHDVQPERLLEQQGDGRAGEALLVQHVLEPRTHAMRDSGVAREHEREHGERAEPERGVGLQWRRNHATARATERDDARTGAAARARQLRELIRSQIGLMVNDVIAEATDLDGNHVVLRRGYYNAATKDGFGWDKVYWKHGLINPNVFKDLISHAHPEENQGGTLVYEVPINKAHCTSGFLGLPSCTDTGESLTMRIVANTNPSYDVPGGGQKGVITMYPLPGGSGVVEVEKNWTLTPPWVNRYAPIN